MQWGGVTLFDQTNMTAFAWTNLQFVALATNTNTVLTFEIRNDPDAFGLDDVSALMLASPTVGSVVAGTNSTTLGWSASSNVHYQVQYTTNLVPALWLNLGGLVTGSNGMLLVSDSSRSSSQRFYRVLLQP